ncbi:MAG: MdtA/MuxA family multidrug efflux RND transporter periplasmic adaptor subunit [Acidobacteriia bacterium]|nr:MdtA/MuxA family multidrug efflux RND transporter periplasmic adaptor subunit [Terriglobia bacterium]
METPRTSGSQGHVEPASPRPSQAVPTHLKKPWVWILVVVLIIGGMYFLRPRNSDPRAAGASSKGGGGKGGREGMITPVVAAQTTQGDIGVYFTGLGAVTPIYTVAVKSRVDGQLMQVHFKEGDLVHRGDPLVEIDPRPFEVQLTQAEGQLMKDQAALDNARLDQARYQALLAHNAVPEQQLATQKALVEQFQGAVKIDQGQINSAKLNITYCHLAAPITGRIGLRLVDPGNIVHANDATGLLVITQIQPISVIFTIAEDQLPMVLAKMRSRRPLTVDAYDRTMATKIASGTLSTVDNEIDQSTGTVRMRATFDNRTNALFPNQFVNARLLVEVKHGVTLVPTAAVQRNSQTTYVYLVKPDSSVTVRPISIGTTEAGVSEVTSGLQAGDVVVMTGVEKLQEGSKVKPQMTGEKTARGS